MRLAGARIGGVVVLILAGGRTALSAQASLAQNAVWTLEGGHGGYCIWYLADPAIARKMVPSSAVLTPAGTGAGLPPLLTNTIKEEPRFAQWIPGSICVGFYQRVSSGSHTVAESKPNRPLIIATSGLAAQNAHNVPGATTYLLDFMTNSPDLSSAADRIGEDMSGLEYTNRIHVEGGDPAVTISASGIVISWSGHPGADSSVGKTRSVSFGYGGPKSANVMVQLESAPATSRFLSGNLQIEGRNNLAKALLASPARAIGPEENGGVTTLTFQTGTKN
jgi:hypothetical protein